MTKGFCSLEQKSRFFGLHVFSFLAGILFQIHGRGNFHVTRDLLSLAQRTALGPGTQECAGRGLLGADLCFGLQLASQCKPVKSVLMSVIVQTNKQTFLLFFFFGGGGGGGLLARWFPPPPPGVLGKARPVRCCPPCASAARAAARS